MGDGKKYTIIIPSGSANSNPANISWSDDATGMTEEQRNELIKDHSHFAVVQWDASAQEPKVNYYLYRNNLNYKATDATCNTSSGEASNLTGADGDVMVLYDTVWWKVSKSGNNWYITFTWDESITDSTWVSPHTFGDDSSETELAEYVGMGVFEGTISSGVLRSINVSVSPSVNYSQNMMYDAAIYNRNWQYNQTLPMTWAWFTIQTYFVKGNRNVQAAYGNGIVNVGGAYAVNYNWDATVPWLNGNTSTQTNGVTVFGIQNPWGNVFKFFGETRCDNQTITFSVLGGKDHRNIEWTDLSTTWKSAGTSANNGIVVDINGTCTEYPFFGSNVSDSVGTYTQWWCDRFRGTTDTIRNVYFGGSYYSGPQSGVLYCITNAAANSAGGDAGSRLHVLIKKQPEPTALKIPVKVSGAWKDSLPQVKVNGAWKNVIGAWTKVNGIWRGIGSTKDPDIYTITWLESSTSANISWSGAAAGLTESQRNELIKDHSHFAVVKWDGSKPVVNYYLYRDNLGYKANDKTCKTTSGLASNLTGTDGDVMLLYDPVWWKVTTSGSGTSRKISISFTWNKSKTDSTWVSPHHYGDYTSSTTYAEYVGMGVFEAYISNNQMRSIYISQRPSGNYSQNSFYGAATYNRNWQYNNTLPMTWAWYIIQLYFVKGNRDCQASYGNGTVSGQVSECNKDWSATNSWNNGTTADYLHGVTALGIQNGWGNIYKYMGETRYDNRVLKFSVLGGKDHHNITGGSASTWKSVTVLNAINGYIITAINGANECPFLPDAGTGSVSGQNYADYAITTTGTDRAILVGGDNTQTERSGPMYIYSNSNTADSHSSYGSRLHVVII